MTHLVRSLTPFVLAAFLLTGCHMQHFPGIQQRPIEQGNLLPPNAVEHLRMGMSIQEVHHLLGLPLLDDTFTVDRLDYVRQWQAGITRPKHLQRLTLFFNPQGKLVKMVRK